MKAQPAESRRLLFGPYRAPKCRVGSKLDCEARDCTMVVAGLSDAPIQWPYAKKRGNRSLILCGDLIRAVQRESLAAVAYHWGVGGSTVSSWRRALGVPRDNEGTLRLVRHYMAIGREASRSEESRAKMSAAHAHRPPCPQFRAAGREAARRPKSEAWKKALSERMRREWATGVRRNAFGRAAGGDGT
jgi:hypothetical protein